MSLSVVGVATGMTREDHHTLQTIVLTLLFVGEYPTRQAPMHVAARVWLAEARERQKGFRLWTWLQVPFWPARCWLFQVQVVFVAHAAVVIMPFAMATGTWTISLSWNVEVLVGTRCSLWWYRRG